MINPKIIHAIEYAHATYPEGFMIVTRRLNYDLGERINTTDILKDGYRIPFLQSPALSPTPIPFQSYAQARTS